MTAQRICRFSGLIREKSNVLIISHDDDLTKTLLKALLYPLRNRYTSGAYFTGLAPTDFERINFGAYGYTLERVKEYLELKSGFDLMLPEEKTPNLFVLDNCNYDKKLMPNIKNKLFASNSRDVFMATQYCMDLSPDVRGRFHYVILHKIYQPDIRRKIYNWFFTFLSEKHFDQIYDQCTQNNNEVFVLDVKSLKINSTDGRITDGLYYYDIKEPEAFKLYVDYIPTLQEQDNKTVTLTLSSKILKCFKTVRRFLGNEDLCEVILDYIDY